MRPRRPAVLPYSPSLDDTPDSASHAFAADNALTGHQLDAVDALRQYTGLRLRDAVEGFDGYRQKLQASRDAALNDVTPQAKALLKPQLDRAYSDALQLGLEHQLGQDHAWSDRSSLDALDANTQEAVLYRKDPARVQALADHGLGEWHKIGERKGWSGADIAQQARNTNGQIFGAVLDQHLQDGNLLPALATLVQAKGQVDPAQWQAMQQSVQAHVDSVMPPAQGGEDTILPSTGDDTLYGGGPHDTIMASDGGDDANGGSPGNGASSPSGEYQIADGRAGKMPPLAAPTNGNDVAKPVEKDRHGRPAPGPAYVLRETGRGKEWIRDTNAAAKAAQLGIGSGIPGRDNSVTSFVPFVGAEAGKGFHGSIPGQIIDNESLPLSAIDLLTPKQVQKIRGLLLPKDHVPGQSVEPLILSMEPRKAIIESFNKLPPDQRQAKIAEIEGELRSMGVPFVSQEEWLASPRYHDVPFEPFTTPERADALATLYAEAEERDRKIRHRPDDPISSVVGGSVRFLSDPLNLLPVGAAGKALFGLAKAGGIKLLTAGGRAALKGEGMEALKDLGIQTGKSTGLGALSGGVGGAIMGAANKLAADQRGEPGSWLDVLRDAGVGMAYGGIFGAAGAKPRMSHAPANESEGGGTRVDNTGTKASPANGDTSGPTAQPLKPNEVPSNAPNLEPPLERPTGPPPALGQLRDEIAIERLLKSKSMAERANLLDKARNDFINNGYKYRGDQVFSKKRGLPKPTSTNPQIVLKPERKVRIDNNGNRIFTSKDPHVADVANALERDTPGYVVCVDCKLIDPNTGDSIGDFDILTQDSVIQIKSGPGTRLPDQVSRYTELTGNKAIGYGPDLSEDTIRKIRKTGGLVATNLGDLRALLKR